MKFWIISDVINVLNFSRFWERCYKKCGLYFNIVFLFKLLISSRDVTGSPLVKDYWTSCCQLRVFATTIFTSREIYCLTG